MNANDEKTGIDTSHSRKWL